jgi:hypothetical protein
MSSGRFCRPVPHFPNVSMGWDNTPRFAWGKTATGNTPTEFRKALQAVFPPAAASDGAAAKTFPD